jgi:hypothetical protein
LRLLARNPGLGAVYFSAGRTLRSALYEKFFSGSQSLVPAV